METVTVVESEEVEYGYCYDLATAFDPLQLFTVRRLHVALLAVEVQEKLLESGLYIPEYLLRDRVAATWHFN